MATPMKRVPCPTPPAAENLPLKDKAQLTIPKRIREYTGWTEGTVLRIVASNPDTVVLRRTELNLDRWRGHGGKKTAAEIQAYIDRARGR